MWRVDSQAFGSPRELHEWLTNNWWTVLVVGSGAVVTTATAAAFARLPFYISVDSALFQHGGWYVLHGGTLYVDIWDLKPPLIYWLTAVLALFSFGNMALLHVYSVLTAVAAVVGGIVFIGATTRRLTDDGFAGLVAALSMFTLTSIYAFPFAGVRPKYLAFLCGAAALFFAVADRYFASGVAAAFAAGFWQLGAPIAFLVVGMALQRAGLSGALRTLAGGAVVTGLTLLPFIITGTVVPLFVEVVLAPIYGVEQYSVRGRLLSVLVELGPGVLLVPVATTGCALALRSDWRQYWWVAAGCGIYALQIFLEFEGAIELVLFYLFLALGAGLLAAEISRPSGQSALAGCLLLLVLITPAWHVGYMSPYKSELIDRRAAHSVPAYDSLPPDPPGVPSMQSIYWEKRQPEYCHYRLSHKQKYFMHVTGGSLTKSTCGQWPYEQNPLPWLVDLLVPGSEANVFGTRPTPIAHRVDV